MTTSRSKVCRGCGEEKPLKEYQRRYDQKGDGWRATCRECDLARRRAAYAARKQRRIAERQVQGWQRYARLWMSGVSQVQ